MLALGGIAVGPSLNVRKAFAEKCDAKISALAIIIKLTELIYFDFFALPALNGAHYSFYFFFLT